MVGADPDANEQVEVGGRDAVLRGGADDFLEFVERIERERLHAVLEISLGDDLLGLDRMHEALDGLRKDLRDQTDFADRRDVVMGDAGIPEDLQQIGRRVCLHRIERAPRELLDEEPGSATRGVRTQQRDRLGRTLLGDSGSPPATGWGGG